MQHQIRRADRSGVAGETKELAKVEFQHRALRHRRLDGIGARETRDRRESASQQNAAATCLVRAQPLHRLGAGRRAIADTALVVAGRDRAIVPTEVITRTDRIAA